MIEINGWISLLNDTDGEGSIREFEKKIPLIKEILNIHDSVYNQFCKLVPLNGSYYIYIGINHNHEGDSLIEIRKIISKISSHAIGSYGLLYYRLHDGENYNKFKILRLSKGKVTIEEDSLLSPCNPLIED